MTDIEHNRQGRLSPAQADVLLARQRRANPLRTVGVLLLLWGYATPIFAVVMVLEARAWRYLPVVLAAGALLAACVTLVFLRIRRKAPPRAQGEPGLPLAPVVAVDGWSVWNPQRGWHPVGQDGAPLVPLYTLVMLPPGPWRFYLHDDQLVGAESARDPGTTWSIVQGGGRTSTSAYCSGAPSAPLPVADPAALFRVVGDALRFDADDLAHNRRGVLSPRQGAGPVTAIEGMLESCLERPGALATNRLLAGGPPIPTPPGSAFAASPYRAWWIVNGRPISIPLAAFWAVPPGLAYRVYLDARTERVVSLEPAPRT